ncbi:hypothetical protein CWI37_0481p0010 [Hamiltosporidium tvaerminnensis]|uniref:Uncharacterized protein n=1 Tax=Hamiltosporidium tvaerminnensis TaxID=1176355 RepID=A0A4V2JV28_9MICR|nr:hypothetical protein CWI37_0481p0010 [Hamiltosporidium tvaerminnensis]
MKSAVYIFLTQFLLCIGSSEIYYRTSVPVYSNISTQNLHVDQVAIPRPNLVYQLNSSGQYYVYNPQFYPSCPNCFQPFPSISEFGYVPMPCYPNPAYISPNHLCIQSYPLYMNAPVMASETNLPLLSNFSISNFAEQPLSRYHTNDTALGSYNHQVVSEAINSCQESPSNNHAGIITPEQDHMQNHSASIHTYMVLNKDKEVVFETKNHAIFKILGSLCRKDVIRRLEYFYPLIEGEYTISIENILHYRKRINDISDAIKSHVEKLSNIRNYETAFMCKLIKKFRSKALFIFHTKNCPMIYCKPIFLLLPLWIESTIQNELTLAKHLFNVSLILNVTKTLMKYNYECLKPSIDQSLKRNMQLGFLYHFRGNKELFYHHFNLIMEFFGDIFTILGREAYYKIFKLHTDSEFLVNNCDNAFLFTLAHFEITAILFDVFILLSKENFDFLHSIINDYEVLKESQENKDLKFLNYMEKMLDEEGYSMSENIRKVFYDLASIYGKLFQEKGYCDFIQNPFSLNFKLWFRENMAGLRRMLLRNIVPKYFDIRNFLTSCNIFLNYICKVTLNPDITPIGFEDILSEKIFRFLQVKNFK